MGLQTSRLMEDFVTPGFQTLRKQGAIINNNMASSRRVLNAPAAGFHAEDRIITDGVVTGHTRFETSGPLSLDVYQHDVFMYYKSESELVSYINSTTNPCPGAEATTLAHAFANASSSDALALVSLAEAGKTLATVAKASRFFQDEFLPFIKELAQPKNRGVITPKGLIRAGTAAASKWLELRYGIMPLVYDLQSYVTLVSNVNKRRRVRFTSSKEGETVLASTSNTSTHTFRVDRTQYYRSRKDIVSSGVLVEPTPDGLASIPDRAGFDRLVSTAWELVPFSFVIDWFLNTSDFLAAHEGRFRLNVLASWTTRTTSITGLYGLVTEGRNYGTGTTYVGTYMRTYSANESYTRYSRVANPNLSPLPSFQLKLNWKKVTDLAALALTAKNWSKTLRL